MTLIDLPDAELTRLRERVAELETECDMALQTLAFAMQYAILTRAARLSPAREADAYLRLLTAATVVYRWTSVGERVAA